MEKRTSILQPDDFKKGMFVAVKDVKNTSPDFDEEDMQNPIQAMIMMRGEGMPSYKHHLEMLKGIVMRIDAINFPFIIATIFENNAQPGNVPKTHSSSLDVRELEFIKLNEEYVNAYLGKNSLPSLLEGKNFLDVQDIDIKSSETLSEILSGLLKKLCTEEKKRKNEN